jgi:hypothetical protein
MSKFIINSVYNKLTHRFDWDYVGELGFVYCKPCTQGGIQYCMKYMRKESDVPEGCKPTFYLSSRRGGGLGYKWCLDHVLWFYQHPDVLTVEIVDKFTGERFTSYIPSLSGIWSCICQRHARIDKK